VSRDRDIERTILDGERNQDAKRLIHNWRRHARVQKFGGTGLIEMQTGLPIGPYAMVCDFAAASGMATWLLEESAVRFHGANCVSCPHRVPVARTHSRVRRKRNAPRRRPSRPARPSAPSCGRFCRQWRYLSRSAFLAFTGRRLTIVQAEAASRLGLIQALGLCT
jgi:hypothetical protein